jgi:hypothetical protein
MAEELTRAGAARRVRVFQVPPDPRRSHYDQRTINNRLMYLGLYNSSGYDNYAPPRISRLYAHPYRVNRVEERILAPRSLRAAQLTATAFMIRDGVIVSLARPLPRARLFSRYEVLDGDRALARVLDPGFDHLTTVVLGTQPDRPVTPEAEPGAAEVVSDQGDLVEVQVTARGASILLLADTHHPGWRAETDVGELPVLTANYAFRAVTVPAGAHRVVWRFRHPGLTAGLWSCGAGLAGAAALAFAALRRPRQLAHTPAPVGRAG